MLRFKLMRIWAPTAALALTSCVSFLPPYDEAVHKQLEKAVEEINKVGTAAALPYRTATFAEVEPYYIAAFSSLGAAEETAAGRTQSFRGRLPARSASIVSQAIGNCRKALEMLRDLHRTQSIDSTDFTDSGVRRTCTIPAMMEARLQR